MYKGSAFVVAAALAMAACAGAGDEDQTTADTTTVPGTDVVDVPTTVPTQDTVITETTVTTDTDTVRGEVPDGAVADSTVPR